MEGVKAPGTAVVLGAAGTEGVKDGCGMPGACSHTHSSSATRAVNTHNAHNTLFVVERSYPDP